MFPTTYTTYMVLYNEGPGEERNAGRAVSVAKGSTGQSLVDRDLLLEGLEADGGYCDS